MTDLSSIRWYVSERRPLFLALAIALVLAAIYWRFGPPTEAQVRQDAAFRDDCRRRYAAAHSAAESLVVDTWPPPVPIEGRKIPARNDLFTCGAARRRGE